MPPFAVSKPYLTIPVELKMTRRMEPFEGSLAKCIHIRQALFGSVIEMTVG